MSLHRFVRSVAAVATAICTTSTLAQEFPNRPLTIISDLSPGATPDIMMRTLAPHMQEILGQPIVVQNKPGASGRIAFRYVATEAPADGYTLLVANQNLATAKGFMKDLEFDPVSDLPAISVVASTPLLLSVNKQQPFHNFSDMISYAKSHPGKIFIGHGGLQTTHNLFLHAINQKYKTEITGVPYKGGSPQMWLAVFANETQMAMFTETAVQSNAAKVTPIAVTGDRRLVSFPDVPTFNELQVPEVVGVQYLLHVRKGTPPEVIQKLSKAISAALPSQA